MEGLSKYISDKLNEGKLLKEIKDDLLTIIDKNIIDYCFIIAKFIPNTYNKIKLNEYSNDKFEIILICWSDNSETFIHDHPDKGCILYLIDGKIEEQLYNDKIILTKTTIIKSGSISYMDNNIGYHKIKCIDKSLSLHFYSPPNYKMRIIKKI
jgi:hypothetical protein